MKSSLRIIAGEFKGRSVSSFGGEYRPTTAIIKKSLFDIIRQGLPGANFLDIFAGCGAVGIEAISRGAGFTAFIEKDHARAFTLRKNLHQLEIPEDKFEVISGDYAAGLDKLSRFDREYDYAYIDPPYGKLNSRRILTDIFESGVVKHGSPVIYECSSLEVREILDSMPSELYPVREKKHGGTTLIFFRAR